MTKPFIITEYDKFVTVTWPELGDMREKTGKIKLLQAAFDQTSSMEVGVVLEMNNKEYDVMWVGEYAQLNENEYMNYLQDMYVIKGIAYRDKTSAKSFHDWLEGKYIWHLLKE